MTLEMKAAGADRAKLKFTAHPHGCLARPLKARETVLVR